MVYMILLWLQRKNILKILLNNRRSLRYNGSNSYLFVSTVKICKFKVKDYEINAAPLRLGNVSKYFPVDNMTLDNRLD